MFGSVAPGEISRELRTRSSTFLKRRRKILGHSLFSSAILAGIALYQMGILKRLPEPRWRGFDGETINGSAQAYSILEVPDALLGLASYATTACLVGMGCENRAQTDPLIPVGMGLKLLADCALAAKLTIDECKEYRAFSLWSLLVAAATWTGLPLALPEVSSAVRELIGKTA